jgi:hypothetical protein
MEVGTGQVATLYGISQVAVHGSFWKNATVSRDIYPAIIKKY